MPISSSQPKPRPDLLARLLARSVEREQAGLLRRLRTIDSRRGARLHVDGRELVGFCSNDYLGLAEHPRLIAALQRAAAEGLGSGSAHLICGHHRQHEQLEGALADWTGRQRALLFSSGVMANHGVLQALLGKGDLCVADKRNHASLLDGARASGARLARYPHADAAAAARQFASQAGAAALLATDGVFSMDGDIAPLTELAGLCARENATLMVDDAHGLGVLGAAGAGSVAAAGLDDDQVPVLMATLGKSLGCFGAFVAGSAALIEGLLQFSRSYVYTTAMPPALAAAACTAVEIARREHWRREHLARLIARFRRGASQLGLALMPSTTPIQPLLLGSAEHAVKAARELESRGLLVVAIRPPTVPAGSARLRIALSVSHQQDDVDRLLDALGACAKPP